MSPLKSSTSIIPNPPHATTLSLALVESGRYVAGLINGALDLVGYLEDSPNLYKTDSNCSND